jgi:hypothetical protein
MSSEMKDLKYRIHLVMEGLAHPKEAEKVYGEPTPEEKALAEAAYNEFLEIIGSIAWGVVRFNLSTPSREIGRQLVASLKERGYELIALDD